MFVSVPTAATAVQVGSVIAASVFSDCSLSDQTPWPWSGLEIKHTNKSNNWKYQGVCHSGCHPFQMWMVVEEHKFTAGREKVSGSSWQQKCCALTGSGRVIQKSDRVNSEWWGHPSAKAEKPFLAWRLHLRLLLHNEIRDEEIQLLTAVSRLSSCLNHHWLVRNSDSWKFNLSNGSETDCTQNIQTLSWCE